LNTYRFWKKEILTNKNYYMNELELKSTRDSQNFWNFTVTLFVLAAAIIFLPMGSVKAMRVLSEMTPFHFILLSLATFRLTRLFVADFIMQWFRDLFMKKIVAHDDIGNVDYIRCEKQPEGFRRIISDLLGCPWCVGVWMAFATLSTYYLAVSGILPAAWVIIYIFALAGSGEFAYALISALLAPRMGKTLLVDEQGVNVLSGQKQSHGHSENVCTECGK
jgi:hypothetical protein